MHVCDWVLREIDAEIGAHVPERGGALLGPPFQRLVSRLVPDPDAATTASTYRPSRALDARVREIERSERLELKGIVHSHPRNLDHPSEQDVAELAVGLRVNGHMPCYVAPIVTAAPAAELGAHELPLASGKISFFAAWRASGEPDGAVVRPLRVQVVPVLRDLEWVARQIGGGAPEVFLSSLGAAAVPAGRVVLHGGLELLLVASEHYPALPPLLLVTHDGATEGLDVAWRLESAPEDRLGEALSAIFDPPGPYRRAFGPRGGPALTRDAERARIAGWERRLTGADPEASAEAFRAALFARSAGVVDASLRGRSVLVAGCGSVGSYVAEQLARSGVGALALLDPDAVEAANLSRSAFEAQDVGRGKPEALARLVLAASPSAAVAIHPVRVDALEPRSLDALVRSSDLIVAATDDPAAQRALNRFAYARGRPALFVGLYAGAQGGEVLATIPERTPCYLCATRTRHGAEAAAGRVAREVDYGTGRLHAETALGADIHHVASAAVKLALALLLPGDSAASLRALAAGLEEGASYLTMSMVPRYWFFPQVFGDTPGQGAYQSVWLTPTRSDDCPVCGAAEHRLDPLDVPLRAPGRDAFAGISRQRSDE